MTTYLVRCRARLAKDCLHRQPSTRQFGDNLPLSEDGTFDGETIVCDVCYVCLLTHGYQALHRTLPADIASYRKAAREWRPRDH